MTLFFCLYIHSIIIIYTCTIFIIKFFFSYECFLLFLDILNAINQLMQCYLLGLPTISWIHCTRRAKWVIVFWMRCKCICMELIKRKPQQITWMTHPFFSVNTSVEIESFNENNKFFRSDFFLTWQLNKRRIQSKRLFRIKFIRK